MRLKVWADRPDRHLSPMTRHFFQVMRHFDNVPPWPRGMDHNATIALKEIFDAGYATLIYSGEERIWNWLEKEKEQNNGK